MKRFSYILSSILIIGIISYFVVDGIQSMKLTTISTDLDVKNINTSELLEYGDSQDKEKNDNETTDEVEEDTTEEENIEEEKNEKTKAVKEETTESVETSSVSNEPVIVNDVLETQIGSLSGYGPDCAGCSGYLASGRYVGNGNITYYDSQYGNVRILSGDSSYPFGTIVRVKNSKFSEFIGIVLDRGGAVGFGKSHLFDLLFATSDEARTNAVSYNTTFEILRYGY